MDRRLFLPLIAGCALAGTATSAGAIPFTITGGSASPSGITAGSSVDVHVSDGLARYFELDLDPTTAIGSTTARFNFLDVTVSGAGYPAAGVPVEVRAQSLAADIPHELYSLADLSVKTTWKSDGLPAAGVPVAFKAKDCNVNLASQTLELGGLDALW